ncbi:MAG: hypothetical protein AAF514_06760 [Verrucomicrobiota bacterium]
MNTKQPKLTSQTSEARTGLTGSVVDQGFRGLPGPFYEPGLSCFEEDCYLVTNEFELVIPSANASPDRS